MCKLTLAFLFTRSSASWGAQQITDEQIRQTLIQAPIASYIGNSRCPYNTVRNDRRCGANSA